jgi:diaminohydroxyphosphoribosylaminopyrimidine deaminase / 5-amino-6-(5-phosphoribosylamino)uracil reductase
MPRPRVTLKLATSLDGRIATALGESRWITGEGARAEVQKLRAAHDAVMIGAETARRDDPSLLARTEPPPAKQPARVVLTSQFDIPFEGKLFANPDQSPLIVFGRERASPARHAILEGAGARIQQVAAKDEALDVVAVLERLHALGFASVLAEGGGKLAASFITADAVDRIEWFRAPIVLGAEGKPAVAALALARLADAPRFKRVALRELGPDIWESYERVS